MSAQHQSATSLLRHRAWRGTLHGPMWASLALARASLTILFRRRLYWGLFALSLMVFFFFFYGQYLVFWITTQFGGESVPIAAFKVSVKDLTRFLGRFALDGSVHTFGNFIWFEGYVVVIVLALAGSVLVGNDFFHGSLPFYLSKPIGRRHYVLGKCLAIGCFINIITTIPAILLWLQAGLLYDWKSYYLDNLHLLGGVLAYGAILTVCLSLLVMATAVWLRQTAPLVMVWMGVFVLMRMLAGWLVDGMKADERWRLIDLWNDLYLLGLWCLGADRSTIRPAEQPAFWEAAAVVIGVCAACLLYLRKRVQAVDVVS